MKIITNLKEKLLDCSVVTIGAFDGIHKGHKHIFSKLKTKSTYYNVPSVVVIFDPHPDKFFNKKILRITDLELQKEKIKKQSIDYLVVLKFNKELSQVSAEDFVKLIVGSLNPKCLVIGHDFVFGHKREGNIESLTHFAKKFNFELKPMDPFKINEHIVSSTLIRETIPEDIEFTNDLLGEPYSIRGIVIKGENRGKLLGFPTMNLKTTTSLLPKNGVYVTKTYIENRSYNSVTNVGHRPTFSEENKKHVETHLMNFNKDIYGSEVKLEFYNYLREEKKFNSTKDLIAQIESDIEKAKETFLRTKTNLTI